MARKVRKDYKAAFERLVGKIRFESELWDEESKMDLNDSLQFRHEGMHSLCEHLLECAERYEAECNGQINENGRVSLHLIDSNTGRCVYDLDCTPSEVPARVWSEILDTVSGTVLRVSTQEDHIHEVRMNGFFGVPIWYVHLAGERYSWVNDDEKVVSGPEIWEAWYRDTAFAAC